MAAKTSTYHQERHFEAKYSGAGARDRAQNFSQAFAGSDFIMAPGGTAAQEIDMAEEEDDQFAFNFPGPGQVPMSPTQSDQASVRSASHYEENYVFKNQATPSRRLKTRNNNIATTNFGSGSRWADDEVQASSSIISGSAASSVKGGSAAGDGTGNWELNAASSRTDLFATPAPSRGQRWKRNLGEVN